MTTVVAAWPRGSWLDASCFRLPIAEPSVKVHSARTTTPGGSYFTAQSFDHTGSKRAADDMDALLFGAVAALRIAEQFEIDAEVDSAVDRLVEKAFSRKSVRLLNRKA